ncbi:MAG: ATP-binding protein [Actinomycetota bacterium]|nr:hypothetical protein [Actinomycetota bacterium]
MKAFKRYATLVVSLALLAAMGSLAVATSAGANRKAQSIHRADRLTQEHTLAGLATQYQLFMAKEAFDYAAAARWSFIPGDPGDAARLKTFVTKATFLKYAAVIVDLQRHPLNAYAPSTGLPQATDPGYRPLLGSLLTGKPGFSSVMSTGTVPVVAVGVPILDGATPKAVFIGYFRPDESALQTYNETLHYGKTGVGILVDSAHTVVASTNPDAVAKPAPAGPALSALGAGKEGFSEFTRNGVRKFVAYSPLGQGGWAVYAEQDASEFFGPIRSGGFRVVLMLLALLAVAAGALAFANHRRQLALRQAYEYKGDLLANTTHELKTPLTAIRGAAMTLGTRWREMAPEQVDTFLGMIHRRCDGLAKLIEKILIGARLEAGRELALRLESIQTEPLLRRIASEFQDASPKHDVVVDADDSWVGADQQAMDQILGLLTENAIKYSPDGGRISLACHREGDYVRLSVTDEGIGMSAEDAERIFDAYYKASRGDQQTFGGVGLGLSIARHLVQRHGGEIGVTSKVRRGSTFSFTLPAVEAPVVGHVQTMVDVR